MRTLRGPFKFGELFFFAGVCFCWSALAGNGLNTDWLVKVGSVVWEKFAARISLRGSLKWVTKLGA